MLSINISHFYCKTKKRENNYAVIHNPATWVYLSVGLCVVFVSRTMALSTAEHCDNASIFHIQSAFVFHQPIARRMAHMSAYPTAIWLWSVTYLILTYDADFPRAIISYFENCLKNAAKMFKEFFLRKLSATVCFKSAIEWIFMSAWRSYKRGKS